MASAGREAGFASPASLVRTAMVADERSGFGHQMGLQMDGQQGQERRGEAGSGECWAGGKMSTGFRGSCHFRFLSRW